MNKTTLDNLNCDSIELHHLPKGQSGPQTVTLTYNRKDPADAVKHLHNLANCIEQELLVAGTSYEITLVLHGHDDGDPCFVGTVTRDTNAVMPPPTINLLE